MTQTFCDIFRRTAGQIWKRSTSAATLKMPMNEETITETALLQLAELVPESSMKVIAATKAREAVYGGDWEWWFRRPDGKGVGFRIQAKRLFPSGRFNSLHISNQATAQITKLETMAGSTMVPLYCFYNYSHPHVPFSSTKRTCQHEYNLPTYWGAALAHTRHVREIGSNDAVSLLPIMRPWHELVCTAAVGDLPTAALANVKKWASPANIGSGVDGTKSSVTASIGALPDYVTALQEWPETDTSAFGDDYSIRDVILAERDLRGIVILSDSDGLPGDRA